MFRARNSRIDHRACRIPGSSNIDIAIAFALLPAGHLEPGLFGTGYPEDGAHNRHMWETIGMDRIPFITRKKRDPVILKEGRNDDKLHQGAF